MKLSICIPARNEEWLQDTIDDIKRHSKADTKVLVALDNWENPPEVKNADVVIRTKLGQRGATNALVELADTEYVAKCDAHCSFSDGFDVELLNRLDKDTVLVPALHNLHAYDWVCENGHQHFQGLYPKCEQCGSTNLHKEKVWQIVSKPSKVSYYFDTRLHFQYLEEQSTEMEPETMSIQGSFFSVAKETYQKLNLCDEEMGSWGQQGTEVACKMWLSGRRVLSTRSAFYGHQFRETEGFPYENKDEDIFFAQAYSRSLFLKNAWPQQVRSIQWLIEKFGYPGDWTPEKVEQLCTPFDKEAVV